LIKNKLKLKLSFVGNLHVKAYGEAYTLSLLDEFLTFDFPGAFFSPKFKSGAWDGKKKYLTNVRKIFPVGLLFDVYKFCDKNNIEIQFINKYDSCKPSIESAPIDLLDNIELRDYQIDAINKAIRNPFGIVKAATGSGKTEIICGIIKCFSNVPLILILVNSIDLVVQARERLELRGIKDVGVCYGEEKSVDNKRIIISTVQSMVVHEFEEYTDKKGKKRRKKVGQHFRYPELLEYAEMIICDECKYNSSLSYVHILQKCKATRRYGFDATPFDKFDKLNEFEVKKYLGDVIFDISAYKLINEDGILSAANIHMVNLEDDFFEDAYDLDYQTAYKELICDNVYRNKLISKLVKICGKKILILVRHINHGKQLEELIEGSSFIYGADDASTRKRHIDEFNSTTTGKILIGSTIFDEGIDFSKGVDSLIVAGSGRSYKKTIQRLGRALRKNSKGVVNVYDFNDYSNKHLKRHSLLRKKYYKMEGHVVKNFSTGQILKSSTSSK